MRMNNNMTKNKDKNKLITDGTDNNNIEEEYNPMEQANKNMNYFMPLMSISIALIAPLGLALYWLVNNILMIMERLILARVIKEEE